MNFGQSLVAPSGPALGALVPEPASVFSIGVFGVLATLGRRRVRGA
jgi:hypothetical protein